MIEPTAEQIEALRKPRLRDWQHETAQELRQRFPDHAGAGPPEATGALVARAVEVGPSYGVTSGYDVRRLAECLLLYGPAFPEGEHDAWAKRILRRDDLGGREKMDAISEYETFALAFRGPGQ